MTSVMIKLSIAVSPRSHPRIAGSVLTTQGVGITDFLGRRK